MGSGAAEARTLSCRRCHRHHPAHLAQRRRLSDQDPALFRICLHHLVHPADSVHVRRHGVDVDRQIRRKSGMTVSPSTTSPQKPAGTWWNSGSCSAPWPFSTRSAHGLTCKHFGARVEKMQFLLMYFAPTFMCDCHPGLDRGRQEGPHLHHHCRHLGRPHDLRGRHLHLVGHGHRHVHPRLCLQGHDGDRHRRDPAQSQPADQAGWLLSAGGTDRRSRI